MGVKNRGGLLRKEKEKEKMRDCEGSVLIYPQGSLRCVPSGTPRRSRLVYHPGQPKISYMHAYGSPLLTLDLDLLFCVL